MNNFNVEEYLTIANEEKIKQGLENYIPLYPMLRLEKEKLYIGVMLVEENDNVWDLNETIKSKYWLLIDVKTNQVLAFNQTEKKDFVVENIVSKKKENKLKELAKYTIEKELQYKEYLLKDIKEEQLPLQKKLSSILGTEIDMEGEKVNLKDYLVANFEEELKSKISDLVSILIQSKYSSLTFYYDKLFEQIVEEYKNNRSMNKEKLKLCIEIMENYYDGVIGIANFFNLNLSKDYF